MRAYTFSDITDGCTAEALRGVLTGYVGSDSVAADLQHYADHPGDWDDVWRLILEGYWRQNDNGDWLSGDYVHGKWVDGDWVWLDDANGDIEWNNQIVTREQYDAEQEAQQEAEAEYERRREAEE
jgi:hypothetical protein